MPSALGPWGCGVWSLLNVGKGTKNNFSHQTGRYQGLTWDLTGFN